MTERELRKMSYEELTELAQMAKKEVERRYEAEHTKAWGAVVDAITNYITNYDSIMVMVPDDCCEAGGNKENLDLSTTGYIIVQEVR